MVINWYLVNPPRRTKAGEERHALAFASFSGPVQPNVRNISGTRSARTGQQDWAIIEKTAIGIGAPIMEEPHSKPTPPPDSPVVPFLDSWGRPQIQITLLVLHIGLLTAAIALTPAAYFFELGYYVGTVLLFGSILLWFLLYSLNTSRGVWMFCALALAQAGLIAFIGMRFRTENRALQQILAEAMQQRNVFRQAPVDWRGTTTATHEGPGCGDKGK